MDLKLKNQISWRNGCHSRIKLIQDLENEILHKSAKKTVEFHCLDLPKCGKVCKNGKMTSQKSCKVCKNENRPSIYRCLFEGDLLKCNTYATFFSTLHFIEVKVLYVFFKIDFPFGFDAANFRKVEKKCIFGTLSVLVVQRIL